VFPLRSVPLFDCHTHPDLFPIEEWPKLLRAAQLKGVHGCIAAGVWWDRLEPFLSDFREWVAERTESAEHFRSLFLADSAFPVLTSIGLHPMEVAKRWRDSGGRFDVALANNECRKMCETAYRFRSFLWAVGETGFDLAESSLEGWMSKDELLSAQMHAFRCCSELAHELSLPLIVHSRSAWGLTKKQLENAVSAMSLRFMIHCFPGSSEDAQWLAQWRGFASFGGVLTWSKARRMQEAFKKISYDCLLFETDAPDLAPEFPDGHRPSRNEPQNLELVLRRAAAMKGCSESQLVAFNFNNLICFLGIG
jgi:TatD family hydrolase